MITAVQGFVNRHRRGLAITAGITGGVYLMGKYAKSKLIEFQEKSASERTAKENMKRRFEQNQQDCVFTVLSLLPTLGDQLLHELNVELITAKLQQTRSQRSTPQPTPDSSMVLPPKPTEAGAEPMAVNGEGKKEEGKAAEDHEQGSNGEHRETADTNQPNGQAEFTAEKAADDEAEQCSTTHQDSKANGANGDSVANSVHEDAAATNGDAPQITVQSDDSAATEQATVEQTTAEQAKEGQAVVRDDITAAMDRRIKLELWNELKIMSFTRTVTALYSLTFLTLLTQVQLNLLGRFTYVSSVVALSNTTDASYRMESTSTKGSLSSTNGQLDFQTEKKYLTFSYWLLHEGWRRWSEKVREVVEDVIGGTSLKKTFTAKEFSDLLGQIRARLEYTEVNGNQVHVNMREYMLPDEVADEREVLRAGGVDEFDLVVDPVLGHLLDETRDFIDSDDFSTVLSSTLTATFARFHLALQPTFNPFLLTRGDAVIAEIEDDQDIDRAVPLAQLLPLVARQVHLIIHGVPNEYVESLAMVKELQAFSAIVYSSFSDQLISH
ncbi:peroxin [Mortierella alpina]|uniref:Peroxin n=1 Tax=Mortierella alpina TaxID=64518 RepID=A0A9P6J5M1_MORAP|nr:peroxin [Mortierella alpina]